MKDKIFGVLQRIGRSFMLPIAILPVAGLLLGIGSSFTNETTIATYGLQKILGDGTVLHLSLIHICGQTACQRHLRYAMTETKKAVHLQDLMRISLLQKYMLMEKKLK